MNLGEHKRTLYIRTTGVVFLHRLIHCDGRIVKRNAPFSLYNRVSQYFFAGAEISREVSYINIYIYIEANLN